MMRRSHLALLVATSLVVDVLLLVFQLTAVLGNLEAEVILGTWQTVLPIAWLKRRGDQHHAEQVGRAEAHAEELATHRQEFASMADNVRELHQLHIHGAWPEDRHQSR